MANEKASCTSCHTRRDKSELSRVGLNYICGDNPECRLAYMQRQSKPKDPHPKSKKKKTKKDKGASVALKRQIRKRDVSCRICGGQGMQMEVHHILYRSQGGPDVYWNLILLCDEHHRLVHSRKRYWQPVLLAYIWMHYVEGGGRFSHSVPIVEKSLRQRGLLPENGHHVDDGQLLP